MKIMKLGFLALSLIAPIVAQETPAEEPNGFLAAQANVIDFATGMLNGALTTSIAAAAVAALTDRIFYTNSFGYSSLRITKPQDVKEFLIKSILPATFITPVAILGSATTSYLSSFIIKKIAKLVASNRTDINNGKISTAHKAGVVTGAYAMSLCGVMLLAQAVHSLTQR